MLPTVIRNEIYEGILSNDIIGFHTRSYRHNFLQCCEDLIELRGRLRGRRRAGSATARCGSGPTRCRSTRGAIQAVANRPRVREFEGELLRRRRDHLILRVDRADLSKNVLRGFSAFDVFLEQHPEFREKVTFIAQLMPSRTDVPEYAEYLERIEAVVAVVNHRHGSPDWMPIQLKLRDDLEEAVAAYKHYDVLMVNAMFDGMNLVAKEGPMVNERAGVSILSENTGAHEELGEYALSVNPFDIQELADSIHAALTMPIAGAPAPARGAEVDRHRARSGRLDRRAAGRHPGQGAGRSARAGLRRAVAARGREPFVPARLVEDPPDAVGSSTTGARQRASRGRSGQAVRIFHVVHALGVGGLVSVERPALAQQDDVVRDPLGPPGGRADVVQAVQERVAPRAGERGEELPAAGFWRRAPRWKSSRNVARLCGS